MRIVLLGYGVMGHAVERVAEAAGHDVVLRMDADAPQLEATRFDADVAIEFAGPAGAAMRVREALESGIPVVSGSTGWDEGLAAARDLALDLDGALLHAPNLSLGVAVFERIVRRAARLLDVVPSYRVEVEETHHTRKVDHPSGTARWLADGLVQRIARLEGWRGELMTGSPPRPGRQGRSAPGDDRGADDRGGPELLEVRSYREGDVPGTHVVRATGPDDAVELRHTAFRRDGFARGAVRAAEWLRSRRGVYTLDDMIDDLLATPDRDES